MLERALPAGATGLVVALSGGADSSALLAAAALLRDARARRRSPALTLRALHIDHGLQAASASFQRVCAALCEQLNIPLTVLAAAVDVSGGRSLEEAARDARYAAMRRNLCAGECLLTAHHALDQAETWLLQSLRGAGLKGASAMPACRQFGAGWHVRPFLDMPRAQLLAFGAVLRASIAPCEDAMNSDLRFERGYLRSQVWPNIERRWPGAALALARSARHAADAQALLDEAALHDLGRLRDGETLSLPGLRALSPTRRGNAVRAWLREAGALPPSTARLHEALRQALEAHESAMPAIVWGGHALRRYRQRLFLTAAAPLSLPVAREWRVACETPLDLGPGLGSLVWRQHPGGIDARHAGLAITVRGREGGETLKVSAAANTHTVQHLLQDFGVLPWMRGALPLLFAGAVQTGAVHTGAVHTGSALIAVADLWLDARWCAPQQMGWVPAWHEAPIIS